MSKQAVITGTTLIELVTVILLLGILAAFAVPRFFSKSDFDSRGFFELSLSSVRFAQKLAISSGCDTRILFQGGSFSIRQWPTCIPADHSSATNAVLQPGANNPVTTAPAGVAVGNLDFFFDSIGRPRAVMLAVPPNRPALITDPVNLQLSIASRTLQVEPETGFTRCIAGC